MQKILLILSLIVSLIEAKFQDGDVIFQTSKSNQAHAIIWATKSLYSHIGIIRKIKGKFFVIEAISRVSMTPLKRWIGRGYLKRYTLKRYKNLTKLQKSKLIKESKKYLGRRYDIFFLDGKKRIYCSELVYLIYKDIGITLGEIQKVKELDIDNFIVKKLIKKRWRRHPLCKKKSISFQKCWSLLINQNLITPDSISRDKNLITIYSNYNPLKIIIP